MASCLSVPPSLLLRNCMVQFKADSEYHLEAPLGANERCACYRALRGDQQRVELRVLSEAFAKSADWPAQAKQLRLAALISHKAIRRVLEAAIEHHPPFVAMEW